MSPKKIPAQRQQTLTGFFKPVPKDPEPSVSPVKVSKSEKRLASPCENGDREGEEEEPLFLNKNPKRARHDTVGRRDGNQREKGSGSMVRGFHLQEENGKDGEDDEILAVPTIDAPGTSPFFT